MEYSESNSSVEYYHVSLARAGSPIPILFEPRGDIGASRGDPNRYFPDDEGSRWMLALLSASHDIGATIKLLSPFIAAPNVEREYVQRYRTRFLEPSKLM